MKFGVRESVQFYLNLLLPLAGEIMASRPESTQWVVTAPPLYVIPSAANLLAWEISRHLSVRVVDLRYALPDPQLTRHDLHGGDYSNSDVEQRTRNRQRLHEGAWAPRIDPEDFRDRAVLFINDINVTGTQQEFIRRTLESVHPASIDCLYVIQVEPDLGRANPEIEYWLNHLHLDTFEDFAEIMARADIDYTARCFHRLFGYSLAQLEPLLRSMDPARRERLDQLVTREGSYSGEGNKSKRALLREP